MDDHDLYMDDFGNAADELAYAFVEFWSSYARLLQAAGMVITAFFDIPEERRQVFNDAVLEPASLTSLAKVLGSAMRHVGLDGARELPGKLSEMAARRNRLAHDALSFDLDGTWPELSRRPAFRMQDPSSVTADELRSLASECRALEERVIGLLAALASDGS